MGNVEACCVLKAHMPTVFSFQAMLGLIKKLLYINVMCMYGNSMELNIPVNMNDSHNLKNILFCDYFLL